MVVGAGIIPTPEVSKTSVLLLYQLAICGSSMSHAPQAYETQGTARPGGDQPHIGGRGEI